jgi:hypothetical protein
MNLKGEELLKLEKGESIDYLLSVILDLSVIIKAQNEKIAELERRVNATSRNSSKPPSSDVHHKPKSLRKGSGSEKKQEASKGMKATD